MFLDMNIEKKLEQCENYAIKAMLDLYFHHFYIKLINSEDVRIFGNIFISKILLVFFFFFKRRRP